MHQQSRRSRESPYVTGFGRYVIRIIVLFVATILFIVVTSIIFFPNEPIYLILLAGPRLLLDISLAHPMTGAFIFFLVILMLLGKYFEKH